MTEDNTAFTYQDSITIGTASTGIVKIYGNYADPDAFMDKVMNARKILEETRLLWAIDGRKPLREIKL